MPKKLYKIDKETSPPDGKYNLRRLKRRRTMIPHITIDVILFSNQSTDILGVS